jgi:hypothetical protein
MNRLRPTSTRTGTILIIVAGMSALLAALALTFLVRMRSDVEESQATVRHAQAHIMLVAGCNFVMEHARLGWDPPPIPPEIRPPFHSESFGWIDVRDGQPGPKDETGERIGLPGADGKPVWDDWVNLDLSDAARPAKRCPMYVKRRPPFAISPKAAPNPIPATGPTANRPYVTKVDPAPFKPDFDPLLSTAEYIKGDPAPDLARLVPSWFRVWRAGPATFVITCGVGETNGLRTWDEVRHDGETERFGGDHAAGQAMFHFLQQQEVHLWYLVEWSPFVASSDYQNLQNEFNPKTIETYLQRPINTSQESRSQGKMANPVGTIRSIQRLINEPKYW